MIYDIYMQYDIVQISCYMTYDIVYVVCAIWHCINQVAMCYMTWYSSAKSVIKHAASQSRSESAAGLLIADCRQRRRPRPPRRMLSVCRQCHAACNFVRCGASRASYSARPAELQCGLTAELGRFRIDLQQPERCCSPAPVKEISSRNTGSFTLASAAM